MKLFKPLQTATSLFRRPAKQIGLPPGALIHVGEQKVEKSVLSYIVYNDEAMHGKRDVTLDDCLQAARDDSTAWINLDGIHDVALVEQAGNAFGLHPLALEDILNTGHPPKFEEFDNCALIITKLFYFDPQSFLIESEQFSLVLTARSVLTFQERPGDVFDGVRGRLKRKSGRIRQRGSGYLAYTLIDSVVDSYFHVLARVADRLDQLEGELLTHPTQDLLQQVHQLKGQLNFLRKTVWSMRELAGNLLHSESPLINDDMTVFLRDLYDHALQVQDTVESYREAASGLIDLYMSSVSQRMNEVMQVLTIMASIFIPLTFIAGIYGMNFEIMPELKWRYGYPLALGLMLLCMIGMLWFFKRKKWF